jgi:pyruvate dehydrogenase E1 component alpha subunit
VRADAPGFTRDEQLDAYRKMLLIRRFEEKAGQLYGMGHIGGFCHLYIGQEAVVVGMQMALEPGDQVITAYRDHGHTLAAGMEPKRVMAELTGRHGGCSKGKGGSMHMFSTEKGFYGGHGIVGASVPLGVGLAFADKYRGNGRVCLCYFGDGAANQVRSTRRSTWPSCGSCRWCSSSRTTSMRWAPSIERSSSTTEPCSSAVFRHSRESQVDGMDGARCAPRERAIAAGARRQEAEILEMLTYRYRGHSMSDPAKYRTREEVQHVRETHDPIEQVRQRLLKGGLGEEDLKTIDREVRDTVNAAADFASPTPSRRGELTPTC